MKRLLGILGTLSLISTVGIQVVACQKKPQIRDLKKVANRDLKGLDKLDSTTILARFNELNDLDLVLDHDVTIEEIEPEQALIRALSQSTLVTGQVVVGFYDASIKSQPTKYLDANNQVQTTDKQDLADEDITTITQLGFYEDQNHQIRAVRMPKVVEQVPNKLPRQITSLLNMFVLTINFNQDLSSWNVSNIDDMTQMFGFAKSFNNGGKALTWGEKTKNVIGMSGMFYDARNFNQDISNWDVSNVVDMERMFLSATEFNQDLSKWNVSNVKDMRFMFGNAANFNNKGKILNWDEKTKKVTDMFGMFQGAINFNQDIGNWNTSNVTTMGQMFQNAIQFDQDLTRWDVKKVTQHQDFATGAGFANKPEKHPQFGK